MRKLNELRKHFSVTQKIVFGVACAVFILAVLNIAWYAYNLLVVPMPTQGGTYREGIVSVPRFINPVLALTEADRDMTELLFSGLIRFDDQSKPIGDLAQSWNISEDGRIYTFNLKENARFHDGTPITAEDVVFTIERIKDPQTGSTLRPTFEGVSVNAVSTHVVSFSLKDAYAPFLDTLTVGIIPKHIWNNVPAINMNWSRLNTESIVGSGPYMFKELQSDNGGIPTSYDLTAFRTSYHQSYIDDITLVFYTKIEDALLALEKGEIDGLHSVPYERIKELEDKGFAVHTAAFPRIYALFFNQNHNPVLTHPEVRQALSAAVDRQGIASDIYVGYAKPIIDPLGLSTSTENAVSMSSILEKNGWKKNTAGIYERTVLKQTETLSFAIAAPNTPELKAIATKVKDAWEKEGASVTLSLLESADLQKNIIRPRNFDVLVFGQFYGRTPDPYPFWHSSQRNDPGLNISQYVSIDVDRALEIGRTSPDVGRRASALISFTGNILKDRPAVFLVNPSFIYVTKKDVMNVVIPSRLSPSERFAFIDSWYIETQRIWKFLANN